MYNRLSTGPSFWIVVHSMAIVTEIFGVLMLMAPDGPSPVFGLSAVLTDAYAVCGVVRWINLRGDPRHAKRPPDDP